LASAGTAESKGVSARASVALAKMADFIDAGSLQESSSSIRKASESSAEAAIAT
jgi:hypothetical protein